MTTYFDSLGMSQFMTRPLSICHRFPLFFNIEFPFLFNALHWILCCLTRNITVPSLFISWYCALWFCFSPLCERMLYINNIVYLFLSKSSSIFYFIRIYLYWEAIYYVPGTMSSNFLYTISYLLLRTNPRRWPFYHYFSDEEIKVQKG